MTLQFIGPMLDQLPRPLFGPLAVLVMADGRYSPQRRDGLLSMLSTYCRDQRIDVTNEGVEDALRLQQMTPQLVDRPELLGDWLRAVHRLAGATRDPAAWSTLAQALERCERVFVTGCVGPRGEPLP